MKKEDRKEKKSKKERRSQKKRPRGVKKAVPAKAPVRVRTWSAQRAETSAEMLARPIERPGVTVGGAGLHGRRRADR